MKKDVLNCKVPTCIRPSAMYRAYLLCGHLPSF